DFACGEIIGSLVRGNTVLVQATQLLLWLEHRGAVSQHRQPVRTAEAGRPGAYHGDGAPGRGCAFEQRNLLVEDRIGGVALQQSDAHRPVFVRVTHARLLAQNLGRTHPRAHATHDVRAQDRVCRSLEVAAADFLDEAGDV